MDPLSALASLLSMGSSLKNIFSGGAIDMTKLVNDIVSQLQKVIHQEIVDQDIKDAKSLADTLISNIKNQYITAVDAKEKPDQLVKILDRFNVLADDTGSPLAQANLMKQIWQDSATITQQKQQAATLYMTLTTLILAVIQELARKTDDNKAILLEIENFAKEFSTNAKTVCDMVNNERLAKFVSLKEVPESATWVIRDTWLPKKLVVVINAYYVMSHLQERVEKCRMMAGLMRNSYEGALHNDVDLKKCQKLPEFRDELKSEFPLIKIGFYGDPVPTSDPSQLYAQVANYQKWRLGSYGTIDSLQKLVENPLPKPG